MLAYLTIRQSAPSAAVASSSAHRSITPSFASPHPVWCQLLGSRSLNNLRNFEFYPFGLTIVCDFCNKAPVGTSEEVRKVPVIIEICGSVIELSLIPFSTESLIQNIKC
jgi:hypothetical protein